MNAKEQLEAFKAEERVEGFYKNLSEKEKIQRNIRYTELKIAIDIENAKIKAFNEAKEAAFKELAKKHDAERIALGKEWQAKEEAL